MACLAHYRVNKLMEEDQAFVNMITKAESLIDSLYPTFKEGLVKEMNVDILKQTILDSIWSSDPDADWKEANALLKQIFNDDNDKKLYQREKELELEMHYETKEKKEFEKVIDTLLKDFMNKTLEKQWAAFKFYMFEEQGLDFDEAEKSVQECEGRLRKLSTIKQHLAL